MIRKFADLAKLRELRTLMGKPSEWPSIFSTLITLFEAELAEDSQQETHIYVSKDDGDDESGDGSAANPFATISKAMEFVPSVLTADHYVHLAEVEDGSAYSAAGLDRKILCLRGSFILCGDAVNVLDSGTLTGVSNNLDFEDSTKSWTPDGFIGKAIRMLDGDAAYNYRTILKNTATDVTTAQETQAGPAASDAYEIIEPVVTVDFSTIEALRAGVGVQGAPSAFAFSATIFPSLNQDRGEYNITNVIMDPTPHFIDGDLTVQGVEGLNSPTLAVANGNLTVGAGLHRGVLDLADAPVDDEHLTGGWGMYWQGEMSFMEAYNLYAYGLVAERFVCTQEDPSRNIFLASGRLYGGGSNTPLTVLSDDTILISVTSGQRNRAFIIQPQPGDTPTYDFAIHIGSPGARVTLLNRLEMDLTGFGISGIRTAADVLLEGPNNRVPNIDVDTGELCLSAIAGARVLTAGATMSTFRVNGGNTAAVSVGGASTTPTVGDTGGAGAFAADGGRLGPAADGSMILREDMLS